MAIVNFAIPSSLDKRIGTKIKEKGFASKAEFFRFAALYFIDAIDKPFISETQRAEYLVDEIQNELRRKYQRKRVPSLKEQLRAI